MTSSSNRSDVRGTERGIERMEAFSDGVFAIVITLLVLDLEIPPPDSESAAASLVAEMLDLWPTFLAYIFSFVVIGIYWVNHHYAGKLYAQTDHYFNLLNLLFLLAISFLPFPTRVLAEYVSDEANRTTAAVLYTASLAFAAATWMLKWLYASLGHRMVDERLDAHFLRRLRIQYVGSFALYLGAVLLTWIDYRLGLSLAVGLTLLYLLPPKSPVYVGRASDEKAQ